MRVETTVVVVVVVHPTPSEGWEHGGRSWSSRSQTLLFTWPLPRDGGMVGDHAVPEAEQLPRVWTSGRTEIESRQRVSGAKSP